MSGAPKLLIDIGNTQLKYAWYNQHHSLQDIYGKPASLEQISSMLECIPDVYFCSVRDSDLYVELVNLMKTKNISYHQARTRKEQFGLINSYAKVENMGSDRWLAMIGAMGLYDGDLLVVDAGTAITCDFIIEGEHVGGWIAPGIDLLRSSISARADRVFDNTKYKPVLSPGKDTHECVAHGALAQLVGMVNEAVKIIESQTSSFSLIITGGNADKLTENLPCKHQAHDNLVLAGLARISHRDGSLPR